MERAFDIVFSLIVLTLALPALVLVPLGILISDPGPVFYRAARVGRGGQVFDMLKFRSMRVSSRGPLITAAHDRRVFAFGKVIRALKLDEIPQLFNVLRGDMAIIGPRPEDPSIVAAHYTDWMHETLQVTPGLTSFGSVFYYARGEALIDEADPEGTYVRRLLPLKLAVDRAHLGQRTLLNDFRVIALTARAVLSKVLGRPMRLAQIDFATAGQWASFAQVSDLD